MPSSSSVTGRSTAAPPPRSTSRSVLNSTTSTNTVTASATKRSLSLGSPGVAGQTGGLGTSSSSSQQGLLGQKLTTSLSQKLLLNFTPSKIRIQSPVVRGFQVVPSQVQSNGLSQMQTPQYSRSNSVTSVTPLQSQSKQPLLYYNQHQSKKSSVVHVLPSNLGMGLPNLVRPAQSLKANNHNITSNLSGAYDLDKSINANGQQSHSFECNSNNSLTITNNDNVNDVILNHNADNDSISEITQNLQQQACTNGQNTATRQWSQSRFERPQGDLPSESDEIQVEKCHSPAEALSNFGRKVNNIIDDRKSNCSFKSQSQAQSRQSRSRTNSDGTFTSSNITQSQQTGCQNFNIPTSQSGITVISGTTQTEIQSQTTTITNKNNINNDQTQRSRSPELHGKNRDHRIQPNTIGISQSETPIRKYIESENMSMNTVPVNVDALLNNIPNLSNQISDGLAEFRDRESVKSDDRDRDRLLNIIKDAQEDLMSLTPPGNQVDRMIAKNSNSGPFGSRKSSKNSTITNGNHDNGNGNNQQLQYQQYQVQQLQYPNSKPGAMSIRRVSSNSARSSIGAGPNSSRVNSSRLNGAPGPSGHNTNIYNKLNQNNSKTSSNNFRNDNVRLNTNQTSNTNLHEPLPGSPFYGVKRKERSRSVSSSPHKKGNPEDERIVDNLRQQAKSQEEKMKNSINSAQKSRKMQAVKDISPPNLRGVDVNNVRGNGNKTLVIDLDGDVNRKPPGVDSEFASDGNNHGNSNFTKLNLSNLKRSPSKQDKKLNRVSLSPLKRRAEQQIKSLKEHSSYLREKQVKKTMTSKDSEKKQFGRSPGRSPSPIRCPSNINNRFSPEQEEDSGSSPVCVIQGSARDDNDHDHLNHQNVSSNRSSPNVSPQFGYKQSLDHNQYHVESVTSVAAENQQVQDYDISTNQMNIPSFGAAPQSQCQPQVVKVNHNDNESHTINPDCDLTKSCYSSTAPIPDEGKARKTVNTNKIYQNQKVESQSQNQSQSNNINVPACSPGVVPTEFSANTTPHHNIFSSGSSPDNYINLNNQDLNSQKKNSQGNTNQNYQQQNLNLNFTFGGMNLNLNQLSNNLVPFLQGTLNAGPNESRNHDLQCPTNRTLITNPTMNLTTSNNNISPLTLRPSPMTLIGTPSIVTVTPSTSQVQPQQNLPVLITDSVRKEQQQRKNLYSNNSNLNNPSQQKGQEQVQVRSASAQPNLMSSTKSISSQRSQKSLNNSTTVIDQGTSTIVTFPKMQFPVLKTPGIFYTNHGNQSHSSMNLVTVTRPVSVPHKPVPVTGCGGTVTGMSTTACHSSSSEVTQGPTSTNASKEGIISSSRGRSEPGNNGLISTEVTDIDSKPTTKSLSDLRVDSSHNQIQTQVDPNTTNSNRKQTTTTVTRRVYRLPSCSPIDNAFVLYNPVPVNAQILNVPTVQQAQIQSVTADSSGSGNSPMSQTLPPKYYIRNPKTGLLTCIVGINSAQDNDEEDNLNQNNVTVDKLISGQVSKGQSDDPASDSELPQPMPSSPEPAMLSRSQENLLNQNESLSIEEIIKDHSNYGAAASPDSIAAESNVNLNDINGESINADHSVNSESLSVKNSLQKDHSDSNPKVASVIRESLDSKTKSKDSISTKSMQSIKSAKSQTKTQSHPSQSAAATGAVGKNKRISGNTVTGTGISNSGSRLSSARGKDSVNGKPNVTSERMKNINNKSNSNSNDNSSTSVSRIPTARKSSSQNIKTSNQQTVIPPMQIIGADTVIASDPQYQVKVVDLEVGNHNDNIDNLNTSRVVSEVTEILKNVVEKNSISPQQSLSQSISLRQQEDFNLKQKSGVEDQPQVQISTQNHNVINECVQHPKGASPTDQTIPLIQSESGNSSLQGSGFRYLKQQIQNCARSMNQTANTTIFYGGYGGYYANHNLSNGLNGNVIDIGSKFRGRSPITMQPFVTAVSVDAVSDIKNLAVENLSNSQKSNSIISLVDADGIDALNSNGLQQLQDNDSIQEIEQSQMEQHIEVTLKNKTLNSEKLKVQQPETDLEDLKTPLDDVPKYNFISGKEFFHTRTGSGRSSSVHSPSLRSRILANGQKLSRNESRSPKNLNDCNNLNVKKSLSVKPSNKKYPGTESVSDNYNLNTVITSDDVSTNEGSQLAQQQYYPGIVKMTSSQLLLPNTSNIGNFSTRGGSNSNGFNLSTNLKRYSGPPISNSIQITQQAQQQISQTKTTSKSSEISLTSAHMSNISEHLHNRQLDEAEKILADEEKKLKEREEKVRLSLELQSKNLSTLDKAQNFADELIKRSRSNSPVQQNQNNSCQNLNLLNQVSNNQNQQNNILSTNTVTVTGGLHSTQYYPRSRSLSPNVTNQTNFRKASSLCPPRPYSQASVSLTSNQSLYGNTGSLSLSSLKARGILRESILPDHVAQFYSVTSKMQAEADSANLLLLNQQQHQESAVTVTSDHDVIEVDQNLVHQNQVDLNDNTDNDQSIQDNQYHPDAVSIQKQQIDGSEPELNKQVTESEVAVDNLNEPHASSDLNKMKYQSSLVLDPVFTVEHRLQRNAHKRSQLIRAVSAAESRISIFDSEIEDCHKQHKHLDRLKTQLVQETLHTPSRKHKNAEKLQNLLVQKESIEKFQLPNLEEKRGMELAYLREIKKILQTRSAEADNLLGEVTRKRTKSKESQSQAQTLDESLQEGTLESESGTSNIIKNDKSEWTSTTLGQQYQQGLHQSMSMNQFKPESRITQSNSISKYNKKFQQDNHKFSSTNIFCNTNGKSDSKSKSSKSSSITSQTTNSQSAYTVGAGGLNNLSKQRYSNTNLNQCSQSNSCSTSLLQRVSASQVPRYTRPLSRKTRTGVVHCPTGGVVNQNFNKTKKKPQQPGSQSKQNVAAAANLNNVQNHQNQTEIIDFLDGNHSSLNSKDNDIDKQFTSYAAESSQQDLNVVRNDVPTMDSLIQNNDLSETSNLDNHDVQANLNDILNFGTVSPIPKIQQQNDIPYSREKMNSMFLKMVQSSQRHQQNGNNVNYNQINNLNSETATVGTESISGTLKSMKSTHSPIHKIDEMERIKLEEHMIEEEERKIREEEEMLLRQIQNQSIQAPNHDNVNMDFNGEEDEEDDFDPISRLDIALAVAEEALRQ